MWIVKMALTEMGPANENAAYHMQENYKMTKLVLPFWAILACSQRFGHVQEILILKFLKWSKRN